MARFGQRAGGGFNPLDDLEILFRANDWRFDRAGEGELVTETPGNWCDHRLSFIWRPELQALSLVCGFGVRPPEARRADLALLLARVNARMWIGHFVLDGEDGGLAYRYTLPFGRAMAEDGVMQDMLDVAVAECERFYPAFQLLLWGGRSPEQALAEALPDCAGHA